MGSNTRLTQSVPPRELTIDDLNALAINRHPTASQKGNVPINPIMSQQRSSFGAYPFRQQPPKYNDLPALPQNVVDFSAGLGDSLLFGFGDNLRTALDIDGGVDRKSGAYKAGELTSLAAGNMGVGRAIYSGIWKGAARGLESEKALSKASDIRNLWKRWSGPALISKKEREAIVPFQQHWQKKLDEIKDFKNKRKEVLTFNPLRDSERAFQRARKSFGKTREDYNKVLIPLSLGQGARVNYSETEGDSSGQRLSMTAEERQQMQQFLESGGKLPIIPKTP
ncbi:hypothetical protein [Aquirhabdus parva]|uniref:Uncharacterized protein n=1 Tax=Aquirhabdus parva TaxID=2283318 RepID=A0A345P989_9GAMM|nr:hypothetical protein [Aquirhabdus parva]AXI03848.1 hypothetical protein HYN46_13990 [Aquirhabdus parva]